ncbi:MAG TPA: selenocysteine-specific translation elongation factor [Fimbriimonas sp.]
MAKLIGTAGHVDHGKTTLIKALTGIDADRLPEEKDRGMTIDIGFAYVDLPGVGRVSIVDVPGHQKFLTNMLVGALGIDVALLCVAADAGVMPQTREHLQILELLPVESLVVAMTRSDQADEVTRELAADEVRALVDQTRFASAPIVFTSATTGEGVETLRSRLSEALGTNAASAASSEDWYMPIDRAFNVKGHGLVVTGTLAQGMLRTGDRAFLEPGHLKVRVRAIHVHGEPQPESEEGKRTAVNLGGAKLEEVARGMALGAPGVLFETRLFDARVRWVGPHRHGQRVRVSVGADEAIGRLFLNDHDPDLAQFRLESAVACAMGQPAIIRRYSPPDLVAGGRIEVPQAAVRRKKEEAVVVSSENPEEAILEAVGSDPNGTQTDEVCRRIGKTPQALGDAFEALAREGKLYGFAGLWMTPEAFEKGYESFAKALNDLHDQKPTQSFVQREQVVHRAGFKWAGKNLDRILSRLASEGRVAVQGTGVRDAGFRVRLTPRQRELLDKVKAELEKEAVNVPTVQEVARSIPVPPQAVEEILRVGTNAGEIVPVGEGIFYTIPQIDRLKLRIAAASGGEPFTAGDMRDALGTTRKYIIPLLEHLDSARFTTRLGEKRVLQDR